MLHLLNSPELQKKLQDPQGRAASLIAANKSPEEIVTELYLAGFGRLPQPDELSECRQFAALCQGSQSRPDGFDVGHAQQQGIPVQPLNQ